MSTTPLVCAFGVVVSVAAALAVLAAVGWIDPLTFSVGDVAVAMVIAVGLLAALGIAVALAERRERGRRYDREVERRRVVALVERRIADGTLDRDIAEQTLDYAGDVRRRGVELAALARWLITASRQPAFQTVLTDIANGKRTLHAPGV